MATGTSFAARERSFPQPEFIAMLYTINIIRSQPMDSINQGTLQYHHGKVVVNTPCWWRLKRIDPGCYLATATRMDKRNDGRTGNKKREAIWFRCKAKFHYPSSIPVNPGDRWEPLPANNGTTTATEVFIHKGSDPLASDGCIVAKDDEVFKIWNSINPKNENNILIYVKDIYLYPGRGI